MRLLTLLTATPLLLLQACQPVDTSAAGAEKQTADPVETALAGIDAMGVRADVEFLANDLMEGRESGTRGYDLAASYVATQYRRMGLEPAGDNGSYFQEVPLRSARPVEGSGQMILHHQSAAEGGNETFVYAEDFLMSGSVSHTESATTAAVVFVGFAVNAPEADYNDFEGLDLTGKIAVVIGGAPPTLDHNQRAYYSSSKVKMKNLVEAGAVGSISLQTPERMQRNPWEDSVRANKFRTSMRFLDKQGEPQGVFPQLKNAAYISPQGVEKLFAGAEKSVEQIFAAARDGVAQGFDLPVSVTLRQQSTHEETRAANVIGRLPGSDAALKNENVIFTAHLDHIGIGAEVDGDKIYNGAYDNAAGIAVMLEVARAFSRMDTKPRRSVLFAAVSAEEVGLLGSDYYASYPTVPIDSIVANVNLDMPLMLYPLSDVIAFGEEHSSISGIMRDAIARVGLSLSPDPMAEEVIFIRSDQYSFVRKGIPSIFLVPGWKSTDPSVNGAEEFGKFFSNHYHKPSDDLDRPFDIDSTRTFTQANWLIGYALANNERRPQWNAGDFFGSRFGGPMAESADTGESPAAH